MYDLRAPNTALGHDSGLARCSVATLCVLTNHLKVAPPYRHLEGQTGTARVRDLYCPYRQSRLPFLQRFPWKPVCQKARFFAPGWECGVRVASWSRWAGPNSTLFCFKLS